MPPPELRIDWKHKKMTTRRRGSCYCDDPKTNYGPAVICWGYGQAWEPYGLTGVRLLRVFELEL